MSEKIIKFLALFGLAVALLALAIGLRADPDKRAVIFMAWGLICLWVVGGGSLMYRLREPAKRLADKIGLDRRLKFALFATLLALIEEAIAVMMTNMAPLLGSERGAAYITASSSYLDVVVFHSVVVFVPMFVAWSFLLDRYDFSPSQVFLLFGLSGTLFETLLGGPQQLLAVGMWSFVYGLMVYLPAYGFVAGHERCQPTWRHYFLALVLPAIFAMPVAFVVNMVHPETVHFEKCLIDTGCKRQ